MNAPDDTSRETSLRRLARWRATARVLVEALPFILQYDNKIIVVKYGGAALEGGQRQKLSPCSCPLYDTARYTGRGRWRGEQVLPPAQSRPNPPSFIPP